MFDMSEYVKDGKVSRSRLATAIVRGKISKSDLEELLSDSLIKDACFSHIKLERKPQSEWTEEYLELLSNAAVAENFNEEYLQYLFEVAQYVQRRGQNKAKKNILLVAVAVAAVGICLFLTACVRQCGAEKNGGGGYVQEAG